MPLYPTYLDVQVKVSSDPLAGQNLRFVADGSLREAVAASDLPKEVGRALIELALTRHSTLVKSEFVVPVPGTAAWWTVTANVNF